MSVESKSDVTFSRDSSEYEGSWHLMRDVFKNNERGITPAMVNEAIEQGEPTDADRDDDGAIVVTLRHEWGDMDYYVVVRVTDRKVKTTYEAAVCNPSNPAKN